jgi:hypothetical protein
MKGDDDRERDEFLECGGVRLFVAPPNPPAPLLPDEDALPPPPSNPRRGLKGGDSAASFVVENGPIAAMLVALIAAAALGSSPVLRLPRRQQAGAQLLRLPSFNVHVNNS